MNRKLIMRNRLSASGSRVITFDNNSFKQCNLEREVANIKSMSISNYFDYDYFPVRIVAGGSSKRRGGGEKRG